jgi:hypothetical protein
MLRWFLRIGGVVTGLAIVPVFMPRAWMDLCHQHLGLGPLPEGPIVEYLARSTSLFYALLGVVLWVLSLDVERHSRAIAAVGAGILACGPVLLVIDLRAGMPVWWTVMEGPWVVVIGAVMLLLRAKARTGTGPRP